MLFSSTSSFDDDDDDKRAYNKAYSFVVVLFPNEDTFSLFSWLSFVRYRFYLGFVINPKQNGALSFLPLSLGKTAACSRHTHSLTQSIVVTR